MTPTASRLGRVLGEESGLLLREEPAESVARTRPDQVNVASEGSGAPTVGPLRPGTALPA